MAQPVTSPFRVLAEDTATRAARRHEPREQQSRRWLTYRRLAYRWLTYRWLAIVACLIAFPAAGWAQETLEEAKALVERAAAHMRDVGPIRAVADFNDPGGAYIDRNLFVVTYDPQRKVVSSLRVPAYLGRNATRFVDEDGKEFGNAIINMAETNGAGWVDYRMTNPATMKIELKTSYVIEVGGYILMVGAYKP
jgi:cytochrome c